MGVRWKVDTDSHLFCVFEKASIRCHRNRAESLRVFISQLGDEPYRTGSQGDPTNYRFLGICSIQSQLVLWRAAQGRPLGARIVTGSVCEAGGAG